MAQRMVHAAAVLSVPGNAAGRVFAFLSALVLPEEAPRAQLAADMHPEPASQRRGPSAKTSFLFDQINA